MKNTPIRKDRSIFHAKNSEKHNRRSNILSCNGAGYRQRFCVMGNHVHVLLKADKVEKLSKFMHLVNSRYSRYYNRINKRVGHVFRNRYRSEPIKNSTQLINCFVYIQNNPLKAGIVENAEDYKYSSYINYLTNRGIVDFEEASKHFNISADNIRKVMNEKSSNNWMKWQLKFMRNVEQVIEK